MRQNKLLQLCFCPISTCTILICTVAGQKLLSSVPQIKHCCCPWLCSWSSSFFFICNSLSEDCVCGACCYQTRDIKIFWRGIQPNPPVKKVHGKDTVTLALLIEEIFSFSSPYLRSKENIFYFSKSIKLYILIDFFLIKPDPASRGQKRLCP